MNTTFSPKSSYLKVMKYRILEISVSSIMTILGVGIVLMLLALSIVGLFGGALKEVFYFISSSQGFSTKTTAVNANPVNVLVTQD